MLVAAEGAGESLPEMANRFRAMVVWMHEEPLVVGRTYFAKHTTRTVRATVSAIRYRVNVNDLDEVPSDRIAMNEIAEVEFETNLPLFFDPYRESRAMGAAILIDSLTNATVGAAMILAPVDAAVELLVHAVSVVLVPGRPKLAAQVRDALVAHGQRAVVIDDELIPDLAVVSVVRALDLAGVVAVSSRRLGESVVAEMEAFARGAVRVEEGADDAAILNGIGGPA